jgi:hypothetical protein
MEIPFPDKTHAGVARTFLIRWVVRKDDPQQQFRWDGKWLIGVPWWEVFVAGLIVPALYFNPLCGRWRRNRRIRRSLCPACGYDVRATPERCPECGGVLSGARDKIIAS